MRFASCDDVHPKLRGLYTLHSYKSLFYAETTLERDRDMGLKNV